MKRSSGRFASDGLHGIKAFISKRPKKRQSSGFLLDYLEKPGLNGQDGDPRSESMVGVLDTKGKHRMGGSTSPVPSASNSRHTRELQGPVGRRSNDNHLRASWDNSDRGLSTGNTPSESSRYSDRSSNLPFVVEEPNLPAHRSLQVSDPGDIVRMALTLNESRRLHLGPGRLAAPGASNARRAVSVGVPVMSGPSSSRAFMRGASHEIPRSPFHGASMDVDLQSPRVSPAPDVAFLQTELDLDYEFSSATIERAEKARVALELSYEYRRLLQLLPPLHPTALSRPSTASSTQADGDQGQVLRDRHSERQLGRSYNPLQYIRNKKVRARERTPLDPEADGWQNVAVVDSWIDLVEVDASHEGFVQDDVVLLPNWEHHSHSHLLGPSINGYSVVVNKKARSKMDWMVEPAELLADAYWLEQHSNKTLIEKRNGAKVFDRFRRPKALDLEARSRRNSSFRRRPPTIEFASPGSEKVLTSQPASDSDGESYVEHVEEPFSAHESRASRIKRKILKRSRANSNASVVSSSDDEARRKSVFHLKRSSSGENIGPLARHMNRIMEEESRNQSMRSIEEPTQESPDDSHRRMAMSEKSPTEMRLPSDRHALVRRDTESTTHTDAPRISVDDYDTLQRSATANTLETIPSGDSQDTEPVKKPRPHSIHFFSRHKNKHHIAETDFAVHGGVEEGLSPVLSHSPERSSVELLRRSESYQSLRSFTSSRKQSRSKSIEDLHGRSPQDERQSPRRVKGGRVGELVREEAPSAVDYSRTSRKGSSASASEDGPTPERRKSSLDLLRPRPKQRHSDPRSQSQDMRYHVQNLPTFISSRSPERRRSRLASKTPSGGESTDISPRTSSPDLSRQPIKDTRRRPPQSSHSQSRSASHSPARSARALAANRRLDRLLSSPGGVLLGAPLVTGLAGITPANQSTWSLPHSTNANANAAQGQGLPASSQHHSPITPRDLASIRTLLLASGIKAHAIVRLASAVPATPSPFLLLAARAHPHAIPPTPRREEPLLAAHLLSAQLSSTTSALTYATHAFRTSTTPALHARLSELRERVANSLTPLVRAAGDDADAFVARLTTADTLAIKTVNDAVDAIVARRRRRFTSLRSAGWRALEWLLLAVMWAIWAAVGVVRAARGAVRGAVRAVRWVVWS